MTKIKLLHLDIETAPDLGMLWTLKVKGWIDPKNIIQDGYVLSFAAKWHGEKKTTFMKTTDGHLKMLKAIHRMLEEADAVVHYNGKRFDIPVLNKEFLLNGLPPLVNPPVQIDLLPLIKRTFHFPSYTLDYVCRRLGLGGKVSTSGREMWWACMNKAHPLHSKSWGLMETYNIGDVQLLEKLYNKVRPWFTQTFGFKRIGEWMDGKRSKP